MVWRTADNFECVLLHLYGAEVKTSGGLLGPYRKSTQLSHKLSSKKFRRSLVLEIAAETEQLFKYSLETCCGSLTLFCKIVLNRLKVRNATAT